MLCVAVFACTRWKATDMGMEIVCFDLEGVFVPEIWINVAERTGIPELRLTTRDIADYDELMTYRLAILEREKIGIRDVQDVIAQMEPLPGAVDFLNWARLNFQVIILSDTFYEFAAPLMKQLGQPVLFCHNLVMDNRGMISGYSLRMPSQKKNAVKALKALNFAVFAAGDSYNDTAMLLESDHGILFNPPQKVIDEFPTLPVTKTYDELKASLIAVSSRPLV